MSRDQELAQIERWIAVHGVKRLPPDAHSDVEIHTFPAKSRAKGVEASAKKRGTRPRLLTREQVEAAIAEHGTQAAAAIALGVGRRTILRALRRPT